MNTLSFLIRWAAIAFLMCVCAYLCQACSQPGYLPPADAQISVSPKFSAEDMASILAAIDTWQAASAGKLHLHVSITDDERDITITPGSPPEGRHWGGETIHVRGKVWIELDVTRMGTMGPAPEGTFTQSVATHELGHAFGLDHMDHGLMIPVGWMGIVIDPDALARFNELY